MVARRLSPLHRDLFEGRRIIPAAVQREEVDRGSSWVWTDSAAIIGQLLDMVGVCCGIAAVFQWRAHYSCCDMVGSGLPVALRAYAKVDHRSTVSLFASRASQSVPVPMEQFSSPGLPTISSLVKLRERHLGQYIKDRILDL
jgi:hypothetical protein